MVGTLMLWGFIAVLFGLSFALLQPVRRRTVQNVSHETSDGE